MNGAVTCEQNNPDNRLITADGIRIEANHLPKAGLLVYQHVHEYDHTTLVASGAIRAWCSGVRLGDFEAPAVLFIKAGELHNFESLVDGTVFYCLHNVERSAGNIVSHAPVLSECAPCLRS